MSKIIAAKFPEKSKEKIKEMVVFEATLIPCQILKQSVKVELTDKKGISVQEASLTFSRNLLPDDYDWATGARFKLMVTSAA